MLTRWYRTGVFYSLDVGLFQDANGDGIGDFQGLIARLDYLARLGISLIWLNPIHPSPRRDGGYDVSDYYGVHPRLGSLGDFAAMLHEAGERGIRVMLDLVVNHTSDAPSLVPVRPLRSELAVPGLVCVVRDGAAGPLRGDGVPRRRERNLDL